MEVSKDYHEVLNNIRVLVKESNESMCSSKISDHFGNMHEELVNVIQLNFDNEETWLYECDCKSHVDDLKKWLYQDLSELKDIEFHTRRLSLIRELTKIDSEKVVDSRTFTRPKKRISRPSIEAYNDGYFKMNKSDNKIEDSFSEKPKIDDTFLKKPLEFDLSQPVNISFDKLAANVQEVDSFQNMSPPSLVNSMCSSTFANLMENSYIQNDPVLREIRDSELTEAMLQDEPPLFKSLTDSCTSINSDTPEGFLMRSADSTFRKIYKKNISNDKENILNNTFVNNDSSLVMNSTFVNNAGLDCTYSKDSSTELSSNDACFNKGTNVQATKITPQQQNLKNSNLDSTFTYGASPITLNGTFRKSSKVNTTYDKSLHSNSNEQLSNDLNRTVTIVDTTNHINNIKRRSYIIDNRSSDSEVLLSIKRNSVGCSGGSCDSLDYVSSLSNSSKGSNKMLNMAEVDALVLQQEQSLQVMSTPKPSSRMSKLWEHDIISPIVPVNDDNELSDSNSSNDEFLTVGSNSSRTTPYESDTNLKTSSSSLDNMLSAVEIKKSYPPKSLNALPSKLTRKPENTYSGSYNNLKTLGTGLKGSYTNLKSGIGRGSYTNIAQISKSTKGSYSNLQTLSSNLKASYTQLKPVFTNLPRADVNETITKANTTITKQPTMGVPKQLPDAKGRIAQVAPTLRDIPKIASKMPPPKSIPRASGLPRPISSIPRPAASRIPGLRTDNKTLNYRQASRPVSKVDFDNDF